jgi:phage-related protein
LSYDLEFYQKENGDIPVLREPHSKPIKGKNNKGLYELRGKFSSDISRIFYFSFTGNRFVLLNGFVKKTNKTPEREIARARKYKEDYERRCGDE